MRRNPLGLMAVLVGVSVVPTLLTLSSMPESMTPVSQRSCAEARVEYCG